MSHIVYKSWTHFWDYKTHNSTKQSCQRRMRTLLLWEKVCNTHSICCYNAPLVGESWTLVGWKRHLVVKDSTVQTLRTHRSLSCSLSWPVRSVDGCGDKWDFSRCSWLPIGWSWLAEGGGAECARVLRKDGPVRTAAPRSAGAHARWPQRSVPLRTPASGPEWDVRDLITLRFTRPHLQSRVEQVQDMSGKPTFKILTVAVVYSLFLYVHMRPKCASGKLLTFFIDQSPNGSKAVP